MEGVPWQAHSSSPPSPSNHIILPTPWKFFNPTLIKTNNNSITIHFTTWNFFFFFLKYLYINPALWFARCRPMIFTFSPILWGPTTGNISIRLPSRIDKEGHLCERWFVFVSTCSIAQRSKSWTWDFFGGDDRFTHLMFWKKVYDSLNVPKNQWYLAFFLFIYFFVSHDLLLALLSHLMTCKNYYISQASTYPSTNFLCCLKPYLLYNVTTCKPPS